MWCDNPLRDECVWPRLAAGGGRWVARSGQVLDVSASVNTELTIFGDGLDARYGREETRWPQGWRPEEPRCRRQQ